MATSSALPAPTRLALVVGAAFGVLGGAVGLVLGLLAYPPTAWFAVLEVGVPAALVGAALGLLAGGARQVRPGRGHDRSERP